MNDKYHPIRSALASIAFASEHDLTASLMLAESDFEYACDKETITALLTEFDDAQGEIRALREKAGRWDFLASRMLAADFDYGGEGVQALVFEMPDGFIASADAADTIDRARALLEQKP